MPSPFPAAIATPKFKMPASFQNSRRTAHSPFRIIPRLCRHETMFSGHAINTIWQSASKAAVERAHQTSNLRRTAYTPLRIIPRLCRHETMLTADSINLVRQNNTDRQ